LSLCWKKNGKNLGKTWEKPGKKYGENGGKSRHPSKAGVRSFQHHSDVMSHLEHPRTTGFVLVEVKTEQPTKIKT